MVLRVLLVDDDEALTGIAKVFLERDKDLKVDTSSSAKKALEKLKSDNYDVIVADYQMPEMNGIELLRKLKSEDDATPFILFTGRGREDVAIDALNSGASFYLQKGGDPRTEFAELTNMIKRSARHAQIEKAHAELMVDIQKSRRLLITTLESTTDGILGLDRDGNVLIYNNRFVEIWGIPEQDIKSRNWDQITPSIFNQLKNPEGFKSTVDCGLRELDTQNRSIIEFKDGRVFDYVSNPMHVDDKAVGRIAYFRDITEQRLVENALRQASKKSALLGGITRHDAINQLSVLMAWLDIAMEVGKDLPSMEQLVKVQESARMLQGQLEFTAEYQEVGLKQPQWIDLKTAVFAGVENLDLGGVSLKVDMKGIEIFADPMLTTVFHNLVDNSLKYGEKITEIRLYLQESGGGLIVVCEDDGVGISVGEKEKVFVRGFGKHTGLGLYLVREILELTGIEIKEAGKPGKGARFELLVPVGNHRGGQGGS